jgi:YVTN family beta-propeller protein
VIATLQDVDSESRSTRFDEPVGIAFTGNGQKAYVALSSEDKIAVIDVPSRQIINRLNIRSQDPRALTVAGNRLYVIAFESGNQTQVSGCLPEDIDGDLCTFNAEEQNITGEGYDSDIVQHPNLPDRDLFIFNTDNDEAIETVSGVGTLLYGLTATSSGKVFIAMTDARNYINGRTGTGNPKHSLRELENRAFLNQIGVVDCLGDGCQKSVFDLEPLPPQHPEPEEALAIPFGIQISDNEETLVVTAAGSNILFTIDTRTGSVLGRVDVGWTPRGVVLQSNNVGAPEKAWVYNTIENTVSLIDFISPSNMTVTRTLELDDPTDPEVKLGRFMFNNAKASTTGTFACVSCHPDGLSDQLMWNLDSPQCNRPGCTQLQLRSTMPIRGLRDTAPYHWDNVPGNPYTVSNGASLDNQVEPTCNPDADGEYACIRNLVDGGLASSMCDPLNCQVGPSGMEGALTDEERHAMSVFLLSVPNAQGRERPFDDRVTEQARAGFFQWNHNNGRMTCGNQSCHGMPLMTRIEQKGQFAVPSFRGITDRFLLTNNGRFGGMEYQLRHLPDGPDEKTFAVDGLRLGGGFFLNGGYTEQGPWQMLLENAQQGTSGAFGRQVTLSQNSAQHPQTLLILDALEAVAREGTIMLQGEGVWIDGTAITVSYDGTVYVDRTEMAISLTRNELIEAALAGELVITLTGRMGKAYEPLNPQPILWGDAARNGSWALVEHFGPNQEWGPRTLRLPVIAEGQENLRISFRANGGPWINVSDIQITANEIPVESFITRENNSSVGDNNHIAYGHGWFTADLDSRGLTNLEVTFTLVSEAPVDVHISDGDLGLTNIALGTANTTRIDFPTNAGRGGMQLKGRHIHPNAALLVDGRRVEGTLVCTLGGILPTCDEEKITITLDALPPPANATCPCPGGDDQEGDLPDDSMHLLQVQTPGGLISNEFLIFH